MTINSLSKEIEYAGATYLLIVLGARLQNRDLGDIDLLTPQCISPDFLELIQVAIGKYMGGRKQELHGLVQKLTHREFQVLLLLAEGYSNRKISESLKVTETTVKTHVENLCQKMGAKNRAGAVATAFRLGIVV